MGYLSHLTIESGPLRKRMHRWAPVVALSVVVSVSSLVSLSDAAASTTPKLKISPSTIFYPCSEGNVKFTAKGFPANKKVQLHSGSVGGPTVAKITVNSSGKGSTTIDFENVAAGSYPYYAVHGSATATSTLTIEDCP